MPLFEYACPSCRREFELLVRNGDLPACPTCGCADLTKRLSVPAAHTGRGASLPMASPGPAAMDCGAPSCCRGQCRS